jgi:hypothetical protein
LRDLASLALFAVNCLKGCFFTAKYAKSRKGAQDIPRIYDNTSTQSFLDTFADGCYTTPQMPSSQNVISIFSSKRMSGFIHPKQLFGSQTD